MAFISSLMSAKLPIALEVKGNDTCNRLFLGGTMNDIGHYESNKDDRVTGAKAQFIHSNDDVW